VKDFEQMLEDAFNKLENGEIESFKFPGTLSKGIFTESSGTFPRCVTISKLEKNAEYANTLSKGTKSNRKK
jgi:hypothetical protein